MGIPHSGTQGWWRAGAEQKALAQLVFDCSWCVQDVQAGRGKPRNFTKGIPTSAQCTTSAYCSPVLIVFVAVADRNENRRTYEIRGQSDREGQGVAGATCFCRA